MREQIKELCIFMICGQTLLYFQSGKKYEKICRMILELLVLAGIVGMILNVLQSLGLQGGEMQAAGGAVAGMQQSMEEALSRQLDMENFDENFMAGISMESLVKKYTEKEIKNKYNYFAGQYGLEVVRAEQSEEKLQVFLRELPVESADGGGDGRKEGKAGAADTEDSLEIADIEQIEIGRIRLEESGEDAVKGAGKDMGREETTGREGGAEEREEETGEESKEEKSGPAEVQTGERQLETFRRQLALVLGMEEEKLEVILIE